jgi:hypothetical protein
MSNYNFSPLPNWQLSDGNGKPYAGGLIYTYEAGGTTPKTTYNDDDTANTNPVVLDSEGRATIKLDNGKYRMVFTDGVSATLFDPTTIEGVLIWDIDNIGQDTESLRVVDNFADLEAIPSGDLTDGDAAIVQGCYTPNDGGGGLFVWDSTNTSSTSSIGGIYIIPDGGTTGRWIRQNVEKINPRWFGAKGDGVTDDTLKFAESITYAVAVGLPIVLDYGTYFFGSDPGFLTTTPLVIFNNAVLKWAGFPLNINPSIPCSDANRHFNYTPGADDPVFPANSEIKNVWLDGTTEGWYQYALSDTIDALKGAINDTVVVQDDAGTWVAGSLKITVNGTEYTQSWVTSKDASLTALALQIAANSEVTSATYSSTAHTITIVPATGKSLYVVVTTSGISGGSTVTFTVSKKVGVSLIAGNRFLTSKGTNVASTNNMTLYNDGNYFNITGANTINLINSVGWTSGSEITLYSATAPTIAHNQTASGDYKTILLSDSSDYLLETDAIITLVYDGTYWREKSRSQLVHSTSGTFTATFPTGINVIFSYTKYFDGYVRLSIPTVTGLDSNKTHVASGTPVPSSIRPASAVFPIIIMKNDGGVPTTWIPTLFTIDSTGSITTISCDNSTTSTDFVSCVLYYKL